MGFPPFHRGGPRAALHAPIAPESRCHRRRALRTIVNLRVRDGLERFDANALADAYATVNAEKSRNLSDSISEPEARYGKVAEPDASDLCPDEGTRSSYAHAESSA